MNLVLIVGLVILVLAGGIGVGRAQRVSAQRARDRRQKLAYHDVLVRESQLRIAPSRTLERTDE